MIIIQILQEVYGSLKDITTDDSTSFKYKSSFFKPLTADDNGVFKDVKIAVPLKYLSNFWRYLEVPLINCKIHLELNLSKDCVMSTIADATFKITNTKSSTQLLLYQVKTM